MSISRCCVQQAASGGWGRACLWGPAFLLALACGTLFAADRQVAITIDDLPVAQSGPTACAPEQLMPITGRLLDTIRTQRVPVTAFVIAGNCPALIPDQRQTVLKMWQDAGAEIGNHTYSHQDLSSTPIEDYEKDVLRGDAALKSILPGVKLRFFRSPMLHTGVDAAAKERLEAFLSQHGYRQAPVTFDNSDWMFSYVYANALSRSDTALADKIRQAYVPYMESVVAFYEQRSVEVVGREFPQILLIHANLLNSYELQALIAMLARRGYRFVTLEAALSDGAYRTRDDYAGRMGISIIHRWSMTKGMPRKWEPDEPAWLREEYKRITR